MAATPRIIDYADDATDSGVSCTATAGGCEITLPVALHRRGKTTLLGEFAGGLAVFGPGAVCLAFFHSAWMGIGSLVVLLSTVVALFAIDERRRSRRPRASITLTENALEIVIPGEPGTGDFLWSAPRTSVYM